MTISRGFEQSGEFQGIENSSTQLFMSTVTLLIRAQMNSVLLNSHLETSSCVYSEIMFTIISFFQKLIKGGLE